MSEQQQFCTFYLDEHYFGLPVEDVQEVLRARPITNVPLSNDCITGLINLRGQIITAIDLRPCLEFDVREAGQPSMNVVVRDTEESVSLIVDRIGDVFEVDNHLSHAVPETIRGLSRELIDCTYLLEDRLLIILDTEKLLNSAKQGFSASTSEND